MNYLKDFIKNEDGMETIEFLVVLAVIAGLIGIVVSVGKNIKIKGTKVANHLDGFARTGA